MRIDHKAFAPVSRSILNYSQPKLTILGKLTDAQLVSVRSNAALAVTLLDQVVEQHYPGHSKSSTITSTR